jgi:hypothetical protein
VAELRLVAERQAHRIGVVARGGAAAVAGLPHVAEVGRLVHVEVEVDRVDRDDRRQQRRARVAAGDDVAGRDQPAPDPPGDRGDDPGPFEVELHQAQLRLGDGDGGERGAHRLRPLVDLALRDGVGAAQLVGAAELAQRQLVAGPRLGQPPLRLLLRGQVGALVEGEQQVALADDPPVLEVHPLQRAPDAGADIDRRHGAEAAGVLVPLRDLAPQGPAHGDLGRRGRRRLVLRGGRLVAAGQERRQRQQSRRQEGRNGAHRGTPDTPTGVQGRGRGATGHPPGEAFRLAAGHPRHPRHPASCRPGSAHIGVIPGKPFPARRGPPERSAGRPRRRRGTGGSSPSRPSGCPSPASRRPARRGRGSR